MNALVGAVLGTILGLFAGWALTEYGIRGLRQYMMDVRFELQVCELEHPQGCGMFAVPYPPVVQEPREEEWAI